MRSRLSTGCRIGAIAGLLAAAPIIALAEDYPYSGLFWLAPAGESTSQLERRCALSFLEQRPDGTWSVYHADLAEFTKSRTVVYKKISEGTCRFASETRVEACVATMDKSFPEGEGQTVYDVVTATADERIDTVMIDAASGWETVLQNPTNPDVGFQLTYLRCPFPEDALLSRITPDPTTASQDALNALRFPSEELLADPEVERIVKDLLGQ